MECGLYKVKVNVELIHDIILIPGEIIHVEFVQDGTKNLWPRIHGYCLGNMNIKDNVGRKTFNECFENINC